MKPDEQQPDAGPAKERLDSWKEIASYLKREVRTVQRWEKSEGLPIRRHLHKKQGTVYAYKSELDAWWNQRGVQGSANVEQNTEPAFAASDGPESPSESEPKLHSTEPSAAKWHWIPRNLFANSSTLAAKKRRSEHVDMGLLWKDGLHTGIDRLTTARGTLAALVLIGAVCFLLALASTGDAGSPTVARTQAVEYVPQAPPPAQTLSSSDAMQRVDAPSAESSPSPGASPQQQFEQVQTQPQDQPSVPPQAQPAQDKNTNAKSGWLESLADEIHRGGRKVIEDTATLWNADVKAGHPLAALVSWKSSNQSARRILDSGGLDHGPQFSPDGRRIVFASDRSGSREIWVADADGGNPVRLTDMGAHLTGTPRWSPDGRSIVFDSYPDGSGDIFVVSNGGGTVRRITSAPSMEVVPSWSRDGRTVYFASDRTGQWQVFKKSVTGGDEIQVTRNGGFAAFESHDGKWLYYARHNEAGLWRVPVDGGEEVQVMDQLAAGLWGYWALAANGVYFAQAPDDERRESGKARIEFFSFASGKVSTVAEMDGPPVKWDPGLAISPSGQSILYAQLREQAPGTD